MQDNIISCAKNYKTFGIKYLIISFVFPSEERLDRLINLQVKVARALNSLVTTTEEKGESFKKIRIAYIMHMIHDDIKMFFVYRGVGEY